MAKIIKLLDTYRFANFKYKLANVPTLISKTIDSNGNPIWSYNSKSWKAENKYKGTYSINNADKQHYPEFNKYIPAGIYMEYLGVDDEIAESGFYNVAYLNERNLFMQIEHYRNGHDINTNPINFYTNNVVTNPYDIVEKIPNNISVFEIEDNLDRAVKTNEYQNKEKMVNFFNTILDPNYTSGNKKGAKGIEIQLNVSDGNRIKYLNPYPFIHIENANADLKAFLVIRGVKIAMNVIETSFNGNKHNYIIQYPKYLLNKYHEHYFAADGIVIPEQYIKLGSTGTKFYVGQSEHLFGDPTSRTRYYTNAISTLNTLTRIYYNGESIINIYK